MPKSLRSEEARLSRKGLISSPHVAPLTVFVHTLREKMGAEYDIPYFDPLDGGVMADCLFLLEAPGPQAIATGFVSRNNPDETAKNFLELLAAAGIDRRRTVLWNIVPWYIGSGTKIRPATVRDLGAAAPALTELLQLLPNLSTVVLVGGKASLARSDVERLAPGLRIFSKRTMNCVLAEEPST
jgi:hypothetical protein